MYKILLVVLFVQILSFTKSLGGEPHYLISIPTQNVKSDFQELTNLAYDLVERSNDQITLVVSKEDLSNFQQYTILEERAVRPPAGYKTLQEVEKVLVETAKKYPKIVKLVDLSQEYLGGRRTVHNNTIWALKISSNASQDLDLPNVLVLATHHCRETINAELTLTIIKDMVEGYGKDPKWTKYINEFQSFVVPVVNPDGYDYVFKGNTMWRKNRFGGYGIDLNRNYDLGWDSRCGGSTMTSSQTYRGSRVLSEVESQTIVALSLRHPFAKVLDFHSTGRIIFAGYSYCTPGPKFVNDYILREGAKLAKLANYRAPPIEDTDGMHPEHHYKHTTYYSFLVETYSGGFQPPFATALEEIRRVRPLWVEFFAKNVPLFGHIRDSRTKAPISIAKYKISQMEWKHGESRKVDKFGRYNFFAPGGNYTFIFYANGYQDKTIQIQVPDENSNQSREFNVELTKN